MTESKKNLQERIEKQEEKIQQEQEKLKQLKARYQEEERKKRTRRLIEIGATVESILKCEFSEETLNLFSNFLRENKENLQNVLNPKK